MARIAACESKRLVSCINASLFWLLDLLAAFVFLFVTTPQVYGDGFRKAKAAYDAVGLETLLGHVKRYQAFPNV